MFINWFIAHNPFSRLLKRSKQNVKGNVTKEMAYRLNTFSSHTKHYCLRCDKRNDIENVYFCIRCSEVRCWECIQQLGLKTDILDGKQYRVCFCGDFLKPWDDWYKQVNGLYPEVFKN